MEIIDTYGQLVHLLTTFGLAVVLVLYFVFIRDPKRDRYWKERYDKLIADYHGLHDTYLQLEHDLRPESRPASKEQAQKLTDLGLDRDLYKLYYYACELLAGRRTEDISFFIEDTIRDTNAAWARFKSPFPRVPHIGDLYGVYSNRGASLRKELERILSEEMPEDEKRTVIWNELQTNTVNMKREFQDNLKRFSEGKEVAPYTERAEREDEE